MCRNLSKQNWIECAPWCGKSTFFWETFVLHIRSFCCCCCWCWCFIKYMHMCVHWRCLLIVWNCCLRDTLESIPCVQRCKAMLCYCLDMEHTAIVINNLNRFLIWCYSHKLLCFSIYESSGWGIVFVSVCSVRFDSIWFLLWFSIHIARYDIEDIPFLISDHWAVCLSFGDLHSSLSQSTILSMDSSFHIFLCLELHCALIMHVICSVRCTWCSVRCVYLLRISFYINRYEMV